MNTKEKKKEEFDLREIRSIIWKRKWILIIPTILVACIAYAGSYFIEPVYETSIIISDEVSFKLPPIIGPTEGQRVNRSDELRALQNEIVSSRYIHQLVIRLGLDQDVDLDETAKKMQSQITHLTKEEIKFNLLLEGLRKVISIEFSGRDQVKITVEASDPFVARDMAKALGEIFIEEKGKQRMNEVRGLGTFSYEQLGRYESELEDRIAARTKLEREIINIQLDELILSEENRRDIGSEIEANRLEISDWEREAGQELAKITEIPSRNIILEESLEYGRLKGEIRNQLNAIPNLILRHQWNSAEILNFRARLYSYVDELDAENERLVKIQFADYSDSTQTNIISLMNARTQLNMLYSKKNNLELGYTELQSNIDFILEYQARLEKLGREVSAAQEKRDQFKELQEKASINEDYLRESEIKVIQPAQVPLYPIKPDKNKLLILGIILGLILGGGLALMLELMDNSFKHVEEVEEHLGIPVIGVIPDINSVKKIKSVS